MILPKKVDPPLPPKKDIRQEEASDDFILVSLDLSEIAGDLQYCTGLDASHLMFEHLESNTSVRIPFMRDWFRIIHRLSS